MQLFFIAINAVIDMPDQQPTAGKKLVIILLLTVFHKEVFVAGEPFFPQPVNDLAFLHRLDLYAVFVLYLIDDDRPALLHFALGAGMCRCIAVTVPTAATHQAPVANTLARIIGIVKIRKAK